jgi:hypothetical protein
MTAQEDWTYLAIQFAMGLSDTGTPELSPASSKIA